MLLAFWLLMLAVVAVSVIGLSAWRARLGSDRLVPARVDRVDEDGAIEVTLADGQPARIMLGDLVLSDAAVPFLRHSLPAGTKVRVRRAGEVRLPGGGSVSLELVRRGLARPSK